MPKVEKIEVEKIYSSSENISEKLQFYQKLDGQKFVLGCMIMRVIKDDPTRIPQLLADMDKYITRRADIKRLEDFKDEINRKKR